MKMTGQYTAFGNRLRQIRKGMDMTQEEFAKILGTSKQVLSKYETNQRAPKITLVQKYADKLGVPFVCLLGYASEELGPLMSDNPLDHITKEAREVALAFDKTDLKCRKIVRTALDLKRIPI